MYVLDTSALIGAWTRTYPPDVFRPLWDQLDELGAAGQIVVPEEVQLELAEKDDDLHHWLTQRLESLVRPTTTQLMLEARGVLEKYRGLTKTGTGRGRADPFVIALAGMLDYTVVTEEQGGSDTKPRIPFVCNALGIKCASMLDVIREQEISFHSPP